MICYKATCTTMVEEKAMFNNKTINHDGNEKLESGIIHTIGVNSANPAHDKEVEWEGTPKQNMKIL